MEEILETNPSSTEQQQLPFTTVRANQLSRAKIHPQQYGSANNNSRKRSEEFRR